ALQVLSQTDRVDEINPKLRTVFELDDDVAEIALVGHLRFPTSVEACGIDDRGIGDVARHDDSEPPAISSRVNGEHPSPACPFPGRAVVKQSWPSRRGI